MKRFIILTGLSGAGKSSAMRHLEDLGFYCIDNIPPDLIPNLFHLISNNPEIEKAALVIDVRNPKFESLLSGLIGRLKEGSENVELWFLTARKDVLVKRFSETRRPHPLQKYKPGLGIERLIDEEVKLLQPVEGMADRVIDTSDMTPHDLKRLIKEMLSEERRGLQITFLSFGFKFGVPQAIDNLFDVRFLPNPHFVPELRAKTGLDEDVRGYIMSFPESLDFIDRLRDMVSFTIPLYDREGKSYLTYAIGCTGGQHRSVAVAEILAENTVKEFREFNVFVEHRELKIRKKLS